MKNVFKALLLSSVSLSPLTLLAVGNPAAIYSEMLGYEYVTEEDSAGSRSLCILPDGSKVDAWDFYNGKVKPEYSYCARQGMNVEYREVERDGGTYGEAYCVSKTTLRSSNSNGVPMIDMMKEQGDWTDTDMKSEIFETVIESSSEDGVSLRAGYLPTSYDSRNDNGVCYVTGVKDQGNCGSCYAFATTAIGETSYNKNSGSFKKGSIDNRKTLSESFIMWCMNKSKGCCGISVSYTTNMLSECIEKGICLGNYFPYTTQAPSQCTHYNDPRLQYESYISISPNNTSALKTAIYNYGAVYASVDGYGFSELSNGVYINNSTSINHAVALVGWGVDATEGEYWIMRNSWGASWNGDGYMKVSVNSTNLKRVNMYAFKPKLSYENSYITERNEVPADGELYFNAHQAVRLKSGFVANKGCTFVASIVPHVTKANTPLPGLAKCSESATNSTNGVMIGDVANLIDVNSDESAIAIYPNPTTGMLYVRAQDDNTIDYVEVVNALGKVMLTRESADAEVELDLTEFNPGIYFVKIVSGNESKIEKVVLK